MRSSCSPPCPPPGTCLERLLGGRQVVLRRVQVACTIASMEQAGADVCGLTRTCAVVANCHHRATCGFAPTCRAVTAGRSPASGLIRTVAVVPIWHHRVTWGSTNRRRATGPFRLWRTSRTIMVLPNWQDHMTWPDDPMAPSKLLSPGVDHRLPHQDGPRPDSSCGKDPRHALGRSRARNGTSTVPPIWRDRTTWANARLPVLDLPRAGLDVDLYRGPSHHDPSADPSSG